MRFSEYKALGEKNQAEFHEHHSECVCNKLQEKEAERHRSAEREYDIGRGFYVTVHGAPGMHIHKHGSRFEHPLHELAVEQMRAVTEIHAVFLEWINDKTDDMPPSGEWLTYTCIYNDRKFIPIDGTTLLGESIGNLKYENAKLRQKIATMTPSRPVDASRDEAMREYEKIRTLVAGWSTLYGGDVFAAVRKIIEQREQFKNTVDVLQDTVAKRDAQIDAFSYPKPFPKPPTLEEVEMLYRTGNHVEQWWHPEYMKVAMATIYRLQAKLGTIMAALGENK